MSPFARGLLGGVAEGITDTASLLFQDAIAAKKEERLAKIADRNYARDRKNTLADIKSQRDFQRGLLKEERSYLDGVREIEAGYVTSTQVGDDGSVVGFDRLGKMINIGNIATIDPLLTPALRAYESSQAEASRLGVMSRVDNPAVWERLQRSAEQFNDALTESRRRLGRSDPPSDLPTPEQIMTDGRKLFGDDGTGAGINSVEFDGVTYSGADLQQMRGDFRRDYGDYYGQLYGQ